jgi:hypothetical protein
VSAATATGCRAALGGLVLGLAAFAAGCANSGAGTGYERYIPPEETARGALDAVLSAWKGGQRFGRVATGAVPVEVVDAQWMAGERLQDFAILGEVPGNGPRCFAVRLQLESRREPLRTRFVVFGLDPLWVYRHDDFDMMAHMEHPSDDKPATPAPP